MLNTNRLVHRVGTVNLLAVGGLYLLLDKAAAVSLDPRAVAVACALGLLASLPLAYGRRRLVQVAIPLAVVLAFFAVQFVDWDSRKPFLRALNRVEPGMTVEQVDTVMAGYRRSPAQPGSLGEANTISYRHTDAPWGDGDIGLITIADGRVASREFLPD